MHLLIVEWRNSFWKKFDSTLLKVENCATTWTSIFTKYYLAYCNMYLPIFQKLLFWNIGEKTKYDDVKWISSQQGCCPLQCTGRNWNSLVGNRWCKKHSISIRKQFLALLTKCWGNFLCIYTYLVTTRDVHCTSSLFSWARSLTITSQTKWATITHIHEFLFSKNMSHDHSRSWKSSWCKPKMCMIFFLKMK